MSTLAAGVFGGQDTSENGTLHTSAIRPPGPAWPTAEEVRPTMNDEQLKAAVLEASHDDDGNPTLSCAAAFGLASQHDVTPAQIGRICDQENVRICKCQLGCFK